MNRSEEADRSSNSSGTKESVPFANRKAGLYNSFGVPGPSKSEFEKLSKCGCPVRGKDQRLLYSNWKARAVHNKYVLQLEESQARRLIEKGFDAYEEYVAQVFSGCHALSVV